MGAPLAEESRLRKHRDSFFLGIPPKKSPVAAGLNVTEAPNGFEAVSCAAWRTP
jgi:hypothetical protein